MSILTGNSVSVGADSVTQRSSWQAEMKVAVRDIASLLKQLNLSDDGRPTKIGSFVTQLGAASVSNFPVFVPRPFLNRMIPGDINDPLLRQVLPVAKEDESPGHFSEDPLDESAAVLTPGLLQKYRGRVLLVTTGACAIHCRYCFRQHYPYQNSPVSISQWEPALKEIEADESVNEVILSGGDPLTIVDEKLNMLISRLDAIPHVKRLRIHTRLPIMIPQRVTDQLTQMLKRTRLQAFVVIHSNHANELDVAVEQSLSKLRESDTILLNQTVLLRDINDNVNALVGLSNRLLECGVMPYYLHQLDPVSGTSHFEVAKDRGIELVEKMRAELPGYAVPRYVKELPGEPNKTVWA